MGIGHRLPVLAGLASGLQLAFQAGDLLLQLPDPGFLTAAGAGFLLEGRRLAGQLILERLVLLAHGFEPLQQRVLVALQVVEKGVHLGNCLGGRLLAGDDLLEWRGGGALL